MSVAMPLPTKISSDSNKSTKARTLEASFADGYGQYAPAGINNKVQSWDITWGPLTKAEVDIVEAALDSVGGHGTLTWTPCNETVEKRWRVIGGEYDTPNIGQGLWKITCKITQRFDNI